MGVRERSDQFKRLARSAITDLFDQRRPFGRLALTHVLMTAGDTLFAVSLAGSLFFSISPTAAKDKVILYLILTMGPFAVVAPALGPIIDRSRGARRAMVVASAVGRAALCPFLARDIHSLLLFPEAFAMLVLSKVYLVTKGALVPEMAALGMLDVPTTGVPPTAAGVDASGAGGDAGPAPPGRSPLLPSHRSSGGPATSAVPSAPRTDPTPPYGMPVVRIDDPASGAETVEPDLATLNARLGLLASLSALRVRRARRRHPQTGRGGQRDLGDHRRVRRRRRGRRPTTGRPSDAGTAGRVASARSATSGRNRSARSGRHGASRWHRTSTHGGPATRRTWPPSGPSPSTRSSWP